MRTPFNLTSISEVSSCKEEPEWEDAGELGNPSTIFQL